MGLFCSSLLFPLSLFRLATVLGEITQKSSSSINCGMFYVRDHNHTGRNYLFYVFILQRPRCSATYLPDEKVLTPPGPDWKCPSTIIDRYFVVRAKTTVLVKQGDCILRSAISKCIPLPLFFLTFNKFHTSVIFAMV